MAGLAEIYVFSNLAAGDYREVNVGYGAIISRTPVFMSLCSPGQSRLDRLLSHCPKARRGTSICKCRRWI